MKEKIYIIIYILLICIISVNTICVFMTFKTSLSIGDLYYCSEKDKEYIKRKININYDFDYVYAADVFSKDYRVVVVKKNLIIFPNILSGVEIISQEYGSKDSEIYKYVEEKMQRNDLVKISKFYIPFIIIYIITILLYIFINNKYKKL